MINSYYITLLYASVHYDLQKYLKKIELQNSKSSFN